MVSMRVKSESFLGTRESGPLPSKLLARLHEVNNVFESESHRKAVILALRERKSAGAGFSKKMNSLFCLWSNRLRDVFHVSTYLMFMRLAQEDAIAGDPYGMECLFRFLSYGLEKSFKRELYLDFEDLALLQFKNGDLYGVEKYAAFWHYGGNKVVPPEIAPNTKLMHLTRVKYPTLASFKDIRHIDKEDDFTPEVMQSHLGPELPLSPAASMMGASDFLSEFSFDSTHDDLMFASSPHPAALSASAPSFYPSTQMKQPSARSAKARSIGVVLKFTVQGDHVTVKISAPSVPLPVQQQSFAPPSWRAARSHKRSQSGLTPQRDFLPAYGSYGRSPSGGGSGRATTPARPVGQSWKGKKGYRFGRPRTEGATSDLGTSYGGSSYGMSPIGCSPMGCSGSYRGGFQRLNSSRLEVQSLSTQSHEQLEQEISRLREALEVSKKECAVATQRLREWECLGFQ